MVKRDDYVLVSKLLKSVNPAFLLNLDYIVHAAPFPLVLALWLSLGTAYMFQAPCRFFVLVSLSAVPPFLGFVPKRRLRRFCFFCKNGAWSVFVPSSSILRKVCLRRERAGYLGMGLREWMSRKKVPPEEGEWNQEELIGVKTQSRVLAILCYSTVLLGLLRP